MSYTKTVWHTGDVVTSAGLNNIENGIEALHQLPLIVHCSEDTFINEKQSVSIQYTLDKTYAEIVATNGNTKLLMTDVLDDFEATTIYPLYGFGFYNNSQEYALKFGQLEFKCDTVNDYPICVIEDGTR